MNNIRFARMAMAAPPADRSRFQRWGYQALRCLARLVGVALFGVRCFGRGHVPATGPILICPNHQSFIDPILVGMVFDRRLNYLARKTLFRVPLFRWLIEFFDAIPVDQEGSGLGGLKESIKRLRRSEPVLVFPEGSRTPDGQIGPLMAGVCVLARRSNVPLVPVGIDGAFDVWPIHGYLLRLAPLCVVIGPPILPAEIARMDDQALLSELDRRLRACHTRARRVVRARRGWKDRG